MDLSRPTMDLAGRAKPEASTPPGLLTTTFSMARVTSSRGSSKCRLPPEFSQWFDVTGLTANSQAEITVGEHAYELDANRWGYKFAYIRDSLDAEVAYVTASNDWAGFNDYDSTQDKTLQYKLAFANRSNPLEFGYYGARGSWPLTEGGFDQYYSNGFYAQRDPVNGVPGFLTTYQMNHDSNPGMGAPPRAATEFRTKSSITSASAASSPLGEQLTNDGLGNHTQIGNIDASYHVTRFIMLYAEEALSVGQKPTWMRNGSTLATESRAAVIERVCASRGSNNARCLANGTDAEIHG